MSSSKDDMSEDYVFYKHREDWADVTPIPQNDGPNPVVKIMYSERFEDVYNYFRAIVDRLEYSLRALALTADALRLNATNYSVWNYRRDILKALGSDLYEELRYLEELIEEKEDYQKNYQLWHHRRVIVEWLNDPKDELAFTERILAIDAKNFHAWQHRQWVLKTYNLFEDELRYTDKLLDQDVRNNSAWHQRFFVLESTSGFTSEVIEFELNFVMNRIRLVKNNESSWNYLRGILQRESGNLIGSPEVLQFAEDLFQEGVRSPYLLAFLLDVYVEKCLADVNGEQFAEDRRRAYEIAELLEKKYDTIRCKYWRYVIQIFNKKLKAVGIMI